MKEGLKQRLIGAFVLVALGVIFLPGFFKEQGLQPMDTRTQIPPQPRIDAVEFAAPEQVPEVEPAPRPETMFLPPETSVPSTTPVPSAAPPQVAESAASSIASVPELPLNDKGLLEAWIVQVASLGNREAALKLRDQLQSEGHRAFIREVVTDAGTFNRIFIGPKVDRAEALAIKAQVDDRFKVNAQVRRFEP